MQRVTRTGTLIQGHMESNSKTLALCFTLNEILSSVRVLCELSYTRFTGTRVLGQFQETGPEYPKSCTKGHTKSNPNSSAPHLTSNELRWLQLYLSYRYSSIREFWENRTQIPPHHMKWHIKSNPKFSAPHFTSN